MSSERGGARQARHYMDPPLVHASYILQHSNNGTRGIRFGKVMHPKSMYMCAIAVIMFMGHPWQQRPCHINRQTEEKHSIPDSLYIGIVMLDPAVHKSTV